MGLTERELALATELRHQIHRNPDLSHQERPTMERVMAFLRQHTESLVGKKILTPIYCYAPKNHGVFLKKLPF